MVKAPGSAARGIATAARVASLVRLLSGHPAGLRLTEVAAALQWDPGLTHRYVRTLLAAGLLARGDDARRLVVGPLFTQAVNAAAASADAALHDFQAALHALHAALGETVVLNRWTPHGPQAAWVEESPDSVALTVRLGSVLPLLSTASGQVGLVFGPREQTAPLLAAELALLRRGGKRAPNRFDVQDLQSAVARRGLARGRNFLYGVAAMAAPLHADDGRFWGTITALGPHARFGTAWRGPIARALKDFSKAHAVPASFSARLPSRTPVLFRGERP